MNMLGQNRRVFDPGLECARGLPKRNLRITQDLFGHAHTLPFKLGAFTEAQFLASKAAQASFSLRTSGAVYRSPSMDTTGKLVELAPDQVIQEQDAYHQADV